MSREQDDAPVPVMSDEERLQRVAFLVRDRVVEDLWAEVRRLQERQEEVLR